MKTVPRPGYPGQRHLPPAMDHEEATMPFPKFRDLPRPDETGQPLAWGVWGDEDRLGSPPNAIAVK